MILYVSNAGVLLETGGFKVVVDALNMPTPSLFREIPYAFECALMDGEPPFDGVGLMLVTHAHSDHMDPVKVAAYAKAHPEVPIVSTAQAIKVLRSHAPRADNLVALEPRLLEAEAFEHDGLELTAISLIHDGKQYADVDNLAFVFTGDRLVRHVGDASSCRENLQALAELGTGGTLVAPFPYLAIDSAFALTREILAPERFFAVHLPRPDKDRWNWIKGARRAAEKHQGEMELCLAESEGIVF
jgi:L-ascorbate metabolism protein UlaG (beta-lactamase superfamily)